VRSYSKWYGDIGTAGHPVGGSLPAVFAWISPQVHIQRVPARAADGTTPVALNTIGQTIPVQEALVDRAVWIVDYRTFYDLQAGLPDVSPFMKPFPGLE
jgi:hypothetical protein